MSNGQNEAIWDKKLTKWSYLRWAMEKMKLSETSNWRNEAHGDKQWTKWSYLKSNGQDEATWDYQRTKWSYLRWAIDKMKLSDTSNWRNDVTGDKQWTKLSYLKSNGQNEATGDKQLTKWSYRTQAMDEMKLPNMRTDVVAKSETNLETSSCILIRLPCASLI
jgi:hypothetical protein